MRPRNLMDYDCGEDWELMAANTECAARNDIRTCGDHLMTLSIGALMAWGAHEAVEELELAGFHGL